MTRATLVLVDGSGVSPEMCLHPLFCENRLYKIARLARAQGKRQSACAELACLCAMRLGLGRAPLGGYAYGANGKPCPEHAADGCISITHAGDVGACAWAPSPVGADVEMAGRSLAKLRAKIVSPGEAGAADGELCALWCAKESYVKLTGEGLSRAFATLAVINGVVRADGGAIAHVRAGAALGCRYAVCAREPFALDLYAIPAREALSFLNGGPVPEKA